jgi:hypothetical protein
MTNYLDSYLKSGRCDIDIELLKLWQHSARYYGDKEIKAQMANARRTATMLKKSIEQFSKMRPEQELAIKAAASAMQALANDLTGLASWAKSYHAYCEIKYKKERAETLKAIAWKRWGDDQEAMSFEIAVICELRTIEGRQAFAQWLQNAHHFSHFQSTCVYDPFTNNSSTGDKTKERIEYAEIIENARSAEREFVSFDGKCLHASWSHYEEYLSYRKQVREKAKAVVQAAKIG